MKEAVIVAIILLSALAIVCFTLAGKRDKDDT